MAAIDAIQASGTERVAMLIIDHITSNTACLLPVADLIRACRAHQLAGSHMTMLVDGAHALGSVDLHNLAELDADIYVANCHKWFLCPRGCAFLWARQSLHVRTPAWHTLQLALPHPRVCHRARCSRA
mgnify:CR=1 FL=1